MLALRGDFVPFAVNVAASRGVGERAAVPAARRARRPVVHRPRRRRAERRCNIEYEGEIADYDCRVLTLSVLKGVLAPVVDEPVSFVNAPQIAEQRGIAVRETKSSDARDYVNLIVVRGDQGTHVAATLFGKQQAPRIVGIDGHSVDLPPARHMLVVHNDDSPGMIGRVGTVLGDAEHQHLEHGRRSEPERRGRVDGRSRPTTPVPAEVVAQLIELAGVQSARAIDLG